MERPEPQAAGSAANNAAAADGTGGVSGETQGVRVCSVAEVPHGEALSVPVGGVPVAVVRLGDDWYAIGDVCTHKEVSLADGEVRPDTCELVCPLHGSPFNLRTGEPSEPPASQPVVTYGVVIDGDDVRVVTTEAG